MSLRVGHTPPDTPTPAPAPPRVGRYAELIRDRLWHLSDQITAYQWEHDGTVVQVVKAGGRKRVRVRWDDGSELWLDDDAAQWKLAPYRQAELL
jgi:hypothetical protein